jgi:hypothetical protein
MQYPQRKHGTPLQPEDALRGWKTNHYPKATAET